MHTILQNKRDFTQATVVVHLSVNIVDFWIISILNMRTIKHLDQE